MLVGSMFVKLSPSFNARSQGVGRNWFRQGLVVGNLERKVGAEFEVRISAKAQGKL